MPVATVACVHSRKGMAQCAFQHTQMYNCSLPLSFRYTFWPATTGCIERESCILANGYNAYVRRAK